MISISAHAEFRHNKRARSLRHCWLPACAIGILLSIGSGPSLVLAQGLRFEPTWSIPTYEQTRSRIFSWIDESVSDHAVAEKARSLWPAVELRPMDPSHVLGLAIETFGLVYPKAEQLAEDCNQVAQLPHAPDFKWINDAELAPFARTNLRLYAAQWLVQQSFFDEALAMLADVALADAIDPASVLYCRMVAHQQLVEPDKSRAALVQLLEREDSIPLRYQQLATLLQKDLASLEDESLDHVSRRMNDVRRRLDLGEAGKQVQVVEDGIVDSLDKLIKKIEEQQQSSSSSTAGSAQSSSPMQDSQLPGLKAPGKVDPRDIGHQSGWGDLPPKQREEALQQIGRDYPAHYRQLIEQYFRDLAEQSEKSGER